MRNGSWTTILTRVGLAMACGLFPATPGQAVPAPGPWAAGADPLAPAVTGATGAAGFSLAREGEKWTLTLVYQGRTFRADLPAADPAFILPLDGAVRLQDPWMTFARLETGQPPADQGWSLWGARPAPVHAAAPGVVRTVTDDPVSGPRVDIDHGSCLRTRYLLGRHGRPTATPGARVAAGEVIGELALGLPDDIPFVHFAILLDDGEEQPVALDPAPLLFLASANRASPFAASVLNAAVRARDQARVARLIGLGIDPNRKAVDGTRPLEWAIMGGDAGMARLLVAAGADAREKTAERSGTILEGQGPTIARTGPTLLEFARESADPELLAAVAGQ
jgi:hypothetical protein